METAIIKDKEKASVGPKRPALYSTLKRHCDMALSIILFILSLPLWLLIAFAIKLDSKGPVFFVQQRVGKGGVLFRIYKFRTMYTSAASYERKSVRTGDQCVTRVGKYLRRFSLDEIPQLLNVLKGEMSLVGPRPEMAFLVALYNPLERRRLKVKPGITGLWQIYGRRDLPITEGILFDLRYIQRCSILLDLEILIRTIPSVISGRGAY